MMNPQPSLIATSNQHPASSNELHPSSFILHAVLLLVLFSTPLSAVILDRIAAIVNDDVITQSEVSAVSGLDLHLSGLPKHENVLQDRIDHHLILQQLTRQPPVQIDEEDLQEALNSYTQRRGGVEEQKRFLNSIGMSHEELGAEIREQITIRQFVSFRFRPFINISLEQAEKYYDEVYMQRLVSEGKEIPSFTDSFDNIQKELIQNQVQDRVAEWVQTLRNSANINVKE